MFGRNLPKNEFLVGTSKNECSNKNQHPRDTMSDNFLAKQTTLTFLANFAKKWILGWKFRKTNVWIRISILDIPCVPIFWQNRQHWNFDFFGPNLPKRDIVGGFETVYADKNQMKINREYTTKKRWLRSLLSHAHTRNSLCIQRQAMNTSLKNIDWGVY